MATGRLVLLAACVSVSSLLVARATSRQRRSRCRLAIGAGRWRIFRQALVESLLLAVAGGLAALAVALWTTHAIAVVCPGAVAIGGLALAQRAHADFQPRRFGGGGVTVGLLSGLVGNARRSGLHPQGASGLRVRRLSAHLRRALVATQVGLSLVLLIGSGLLLRSLATLYHVDPGFRTTNLVCFRLDPDVERVRGATCLRLLAAVADATALGAGVESVAVSQIPLLVNYRVVDGMVVEGYRPRPGEDVEAIRDTVSRDYCRTMGMPLKLGRDFEEQDEMTGAKKVLLVNEAFVQWFFDGATPSDTTWVSGGPPMPSRTGRSSGSCAIPGP